MPSPSSTLNSNLRPDLADSFQEFDLAADQAGYIGHRVCPVLEVASQAGQFGRIPLEQLLQSPDTQRAPGSGYSRGNFTFEPDTFACVEHGHEEPVDDREAKMYREYFDAELIATARAYNAVLRDHEQRISDLLFNATTWTGASYTTAVTNEWDDHSNATPIDDIEAAVEKIYDLSGLWPNALVINKKVFRNLRLCDQVRDRITSDGAGSSELAGDITPEQLARAFDLDHIFVGAGSKNTAKEGQTASPAQIWSSEYAMVAKVATTQDPKEPCVARVFHWGEDGSSPDGTVESYREEAARSEVIRVRQDTDEKLLYKEAAHLLSNITT